jgi:hypothetical protein
MKVEPPLFWIFYRDLGAMKNDKNESYGGSWDVVEFPPKEFPTLSTFRRDVGYWTRRR